MLAGKVEIIKAEVSKSTEQAECKTGGMCVTTNHILELLGSQHYKIVDKSIGKINLRAKG